jgi:hypothetical protein
MSGPGATGLRSTATDRGGFAREARRLVGRQCFCVCFRAKPIRARLIRIGRLLIARGVRTVQRRRGLVVV